MSPATAMPTQIAFGNTRARKIATVDAAGATERGLAELMVGRPVLLDIDKGPPKPGATVLELEELRVLDDRDLEAVRSVSVTVREGEIVGIAGVDGNGQTELIDALTGLRHPASGHIRVGTEDLTRATARQALDAGMGHIPEDRQRRGLVLDFTLAENLALHDYAKEPFSKLGWLNPRVCVPSPKIVSDSPRRIWFMKMPTTLR